MVPLPLASTASHSSERHSGHIGPGGCRNAPQDEQRWMRSLPSLAPSKRKALSRLIAGRGRGAVSGCFSRGRYFRMRKRWGPTRCPAWSRDSGGGGRACSFRMLLARPVLQDAEALGPHQLGVLVPVLGPRGHEVAHTEAGGL